MDKKPTQLDIIKQILRKEKKIDNFRCFTERISLRIGARIWDLSKEGWKFRTEKQGKNYIYHLVRDPESIELTLF